MLSLSNFVESSARGYYWIRNFFIPQPSPGLWKFNGLWSNGRAGRRLRPPRRTRSKLGLKFSDRDRMACRGNSAARSFTVFWKIQNFGYRALIMRAIVYDFPSWRIWWLKFFTHRKRSVENFTRFSIPIGNKFFINLEDIKKCFFSLFEWEFLHLIHIIAEKVHILRGRVQAKTKNSAEFSKVYLKKS